MNLKKAITYFKKGYGIRRNWWRKGLFCFCINGSSIYFKDEICKERWIPTLSDLLEKDWELIKFKKISKTKCANISCRKDWHPNYQGNCIYCGCNIFVEEEIK